MTFQMSWQTTLEDFRILSRAHAQSTPWRRAWSVFQTILPFLLAVNAAVSFASGQLNIAFASLVLAILLAARLLHARTSFVQSQFDKQKLGDDDNTAVATEEAVTISNQRSETRLEWTGIEKVERLAAHTILWVSAVVGIIIPDRAFDEDGDAEAFAAFAKEKING